MTCSGCVRNSRPPLWNFPAICSVPNCETDVNNDAQLIEAAREGDKTAYGRLVERYQNRLYNALVRVVGCSEEARDVTQEAFVRAWVKFDSFRGASAFYTWLYRIGFNLAMSRRRQSRPVASLDAARAAAGIEPVDPDGGPEAAASRRELAAQVHAALARLHEDHRQILVLREIEGCDYETISEILEIPVGTVRSRLFRARMQLREQLTDVLEEELEKQM